jgi:hypothetical protein
MEFKIRRARRDRNEEEAGLWKRSGQVSGKESNKARSHCRPEAEKGKTSPTRKLFARLKDDAALSARC